jgi:hypothetical protein
MITHDVLHWVGIKNNNGISHDDIMSQTLDSMHSFQGQLFNMRVSKLRTNNSFAKIIPVFVLVDPI